MNAKLRYIIGSVAALFVGVTSFNATAATATPLVSQVPVTMPADSKLVVFNFDPNASYTILARPNSITNIQLGPDEQLVALALGDTVNWISAKIDGPGGQILIKPIRSDIFTSGTMVTNKRTYQLNFRAVSDRAYWYQRVSWQYPDMVVLGSLNGQKPQISLPEPQFNPMPGMGDPILPSSKPAAKSSGMDRLNFEYTIEGKAEFKPTHVFDDGQFTWIKLPADSQEMPAVFMISDTGDMEIVNFVSKGDYLMIQRLAKGFVLKLGKQEVRISKKG